MRTGRTCTDVLLGVYRPDGTLAWIQGRYGVDTVRLRAARAVELLTGHPAVGQLTDLGGTQELRVRGDAQELLKFLVARTQVTHFELATPSLHDIFVRIAGPQATAGAEHVDR